MIIIIGAITVLLCVFGGFMLEKGNIMVILEALTNEIIIIAGGAIGSLIIMAPKKVLMDIVRNVGLCLKGTPHSRESYDDLLKVLYELFLLGRRNGMIALEEHVLEPKNSSIFKKYPRFAANEHAVEFLCGALRPIIDGKIKPDQLRLLLDAEIERKEIEHHAPVSVVQKTGDAMPGFGIVAAVLGIVITMASITGAVEEIGDACGGGAGGHVSWHFAGLRFCGAAGDQHGICLRGGTGLHALHRRVRDRLCRRHGAGDGGGTGPARLEQRVPAGGRGAGADVQVAQDRQMIFDAWPEKNMPTTAVRGRSPTRTS